MGAQQLERVGLVRGDAQAGDGDARGDRPRFAEAVIAQGAELDEGGRGGTRALSTALRVGVCRGLLVRH